MLSMYMHVYIYMNRHAYLHMSECIRISYREGGMKVSSEPVSFRSAFGGHFDLWLPGAPAFVTPLHLSRKEAMRATHAVVNRLVLAGLLQQHGVPEGDGSAQYTCE